MPVAPTEDGYKWVALSNTTMAVFMSALDGSIVIIALPAIFRGINLDPLAPGNISYLLWMIMGYRLVQAVLVVTVGRLGDMHGRVKIYNSGFAVFTADAVDLPEHRHGAFHRGVLLAPDRRPGDQPSGAVAPRPAAAGRLARDRAPGRRPAAGVVAVRGRARREPGRAPAGADRRPVIGLPRAPARPDWHAVLPEADRGGVPRRPRGRVQRRHRPVPARRGRLADARRPLRPRRDGPTRERNAT